MDVAHLADVCRGLNYRKRMWGSNCTRRSRSIIIHHAPGHLVTDPTETRIKTGLSGAIKVCPYFLNQCFIRLHCPMTSRFQVKHLLTSIIFRLLLVKIIWFISWFSSPPYMPSALKPIPFTPGTYWLSPITLSDTLASSPHGKDYASKHTFAFNARHLSQAIPTRWRLISLFCVASPENTHCVDVSSIYQYIGADYGYSV